MLVEMSISNFRSFKDRQTFSLVKNKSSELPTNAFAVSGMRNFHLLHAAAIYGPNAGGKSNLLRSLYVMKQIVTTSSQRNNTLPITPFRLDNEKRTQPSEFEVVVVVDGIRYQYGFSASEDKIFAEWLYAFPKGRAQKWFERIRNPHTGRDDWQFSTQLLGSKQVWKDATRDNALFLSTAVQLNSTQLKPLFDWFDKTIRFADSRWFRPGYSASLCSKEKKESVLKFLQAADLNIHDIQIRTEEPQSMVLLDDMPEALRELLLKRMEGKRFISIHTVHTNNDGADVVFDLTDESDGTQKLFALAGPWMDVLVNGNILLIDELHDNLHPHLVRFLVSLFHNEKINQKNAQLIFTTHDTSMLDQHIMRRDQIWFCERNKEQATQLYPLTDFSPKKGKENLETAYLSGRYGALPFLQPVYLE